jgi:hypothetical protein
MTSDGGLLGRGGGLQDELPIAVGESFGRGSDVEAKFAGSLMECLPLHFFIGAPECEVAGVGLAKALQFAYGALILALGEIAELDFSFN